jgi:arylsulfatase A-like enzyme
MKRNFHVLFFAGLFALSGACSTYRPEPPNVVFILADQWRAGATGNAGDINVKTPSLDSFAEKAFNFVNAVSVCPVCTPYRASLITGRYPTSTGMFLNDAYLPDEELCLAEVFKNEGYNTAYLGKWHLDGHGRLDFTPPERRQGFDYWMALECSHDYNKMPYYDNDSPEIKYWEDYSPFAVSEASQDYISGQQNSDKPFFLFVSLATPHFPHHTAPEEYKALYSADKIVLNPNVPEEIQDQVRNELVGYYAHCSATDRAIGDLLQKLDELNMMENTIVVFTSDHGEIMGAHGINPTQKQVPFIESANVPFLIHVPEGIEKGRKIDMPITTPDISATLLSLAGITIPGSFEGRDFSKVLDGTAQGADRAALYMSVSSFASVGKEFKKEYRAIKTNQFTYVKDISGAWLLFDDLKDPYQMNNLAGNPAYAEIQKILEEELMGELAWIKDDFRPAAFYLDAWGYELGESDHIPYNMHNSKVQSPERKSN